MSHRGGLCSALTPFGARMHVAEEGAQSPDGKCRPGHVDEQRVQASCRTEGRGSKGGGTDGTSGRQRRCHAQRSAALTMSTAGPRADAPCCWSRSGKHGAERQTAITWTHLVSLETGLSFDLQSRGDSCCAAETIKDKHNVIGCTDQRGKVDFVLTN